MEFRKRFIDEILGEINEMIIDYNHPDDPPPASGPDKTDASDDQSENKGTLILDATCAPQNIAYPQDVNLLDLILDERGVARIERMSFDAYNESDVLISAIENYRARCGHYPERVLADQIYRNRNNLAYCKQNGIRMSGPALVRPKKAEKIDKKETYQDNADRIAAERAKTQLQSWSDNLQA